MAFERCLENRVGAGTDVPELDDVVAAARGQRLAIRRKGQRPHACPVSQESGQETPRSQVPKLDRGIPTPGGQSSAIRRGSHPKHGRAVQIHHRLQFPPLRDTPQSDTLPTC
jgi:hypothetical protein